MLACWRIDPNSRPSFDECRRQIGQYLADIDASAYSFVKNLLSTNSALKPSPNNHDDIGQLIKPEPESQHVKPLRNVARSGKERNGVQFPLHEAPSDSNGQHSSNPFTERNWSKGVTVSIGQERHTPCLYTRGNAQELQEAVQLLKKDGQPFKVDIEAE